MLDEDEAFARRLQLEMLMGLQHAAAAAPWPFFGHVSPPGQFGGQRHGHGYAGAHGGAQEPVFQHFQQPMDQHGFQQWGDGGANGGERGGWHGHGVRQDDGGFAAAFIGGFVREMRGWND